MVNVVINTIIGIRMTKTYTNHASKFNIKKYRVSLGSRFRIDTKCQHTNKNNSYSYCSALTRLRTSAPVIGSIAVTPNRVI